MRIEINLLGGRKRKRGAGGFALPDFRQLGARVKDPLLIGAIGAIAAAVAFVAILFTLQQAKLASLEQDAERIRGESRRYTALIAEKRQSERLRDSLVAELKAIRAIDADRYVWPHILEEVTKALPDYSWLVGVSTLKGQPTLSPEGDTLAVPGVQFLIDGRTSEIASYTGFLRRIAASPWIGAVVEGPATTVIEEDKPMRAFTITATFRQADSAFIRTVPVLQSVR